MKKYFLFLAVLGASFLFYGCAGQKNVTPDVDKNAEIIFFYGRECPHCKVVENYINENKIVDKITFAQGEVYHNKSNAQFMVEKQKECVLAEDMVGAVPFLWTKNKCYIGQDEIIQFFKDKTK